jgi:hypothetical protein
MHHLIESRPQTDHYTVYSFQVDVIAGDAKRGFRAETDIPWEDFKSRVLAYLDSASGEVELVYKFAGDNGRASHLNDAQSFNGVMERLCQKASNARTRAVGLEVKNAVCVYSRDIVQKKGLTMTIRPNAPSASQRRGLVRTTSLPLRAMRELRS